MARPPPTARRPPPGQSRDRDNPTSAGTGAAHRANSAGQRASGPGPNQAANGVAANGRPSARIAKKGAIKRRNQEGRSQEQRQEGRNQENRGGEGRREERRGRDHRDAHRNQEHRRFDAKDRRDSGPRREREKQPDPNSPFAKLAALKAQLEANAKEPR